MLVRKGSVSERAHEERLVVVAGHFTRGTDPRGKARRPAELGFTRILRSHGLAFWSQHGFTLTALSLKNKVQFLYILSA